VINRQSDWGFWTKRGNNMEWHGIRLYKVEAESLSDGKFTGISASLDVAKMEVAREGMMRIDFTYVSEYNPAIARIKFCGFVTLSGKKGEMDIALAKWKKDRFIEKETFETLVNLIKYTAETNGVLVAKALNIAPPIVSPKISLQQKPARRK